MARHTASPAKIAKQQRAESRVLHSFRHRRFHGRERQRHIRRNLRRHAAHGSGERRRIAGRSDDDIERAAVVRVLPVRHVALRHRLDRRIALAHVTDDADDRHALLPIETTEDRPADRVLAAERFPNERLIDDGDERPVGGIALVEIAAALQGMPNAANVPGATIVRSVGGSLVRSRSSGIRSTK